MMVTRDLKRDKADLGTKVFDNFVTEDDQKGRIHNVFEDKHWIGVSITFVHFPRDDVGILTVHL